MPRHQSLAVAALLAIGLLTSCDSKTDAPQPEITVEEATAGFDQRLAEFETTLNEGRIGDMLDFMPPKLLAEVLKQSGVNQKQMKAALQEGWTQTLDTVTLESFAFGEPGPIKSTESGRFYRLIPSELTMSMNDDPDTLVDATSETLALTDGGTWYVVRLDQPPQVELFHKSYPEFESVEVAAPTQTTRNRGDDQ